MTTGDKFQRHTFKPTFKLKVKSVRGRLFTFDVFEEKKTNCWFRLIRGLQHRSRSRSRSRRKVLLGAGAGAGAGILPRSRIRSRSQPKMSRLRIPGFISFGLARPSPNMASYLLGISQWGKIKCLNTCQIASNRSE